MADNGYQVPQEFYSQTRWDNWLKQAKESGFEIKENEDEGSGKESIVFVNMVDDVILACLKVNATLENNLISREDALHVIGDIKELVLSEVEPISEDIDMMIYSVQTSLMAAIASFECYMTGEFDNEASIKELVLAAAEAESEDELEIALDCIAELGANVLDGKELPENIGEGLSYGLVVEWVDGIESICAAMVGSDSYKDMVDDDGSD